MHDVSSPIFTGIDIETMRGLEIGALHNPRLPADHPNAFFLDHASADDLRAKYAENAHMVQFMDAIVDVDFVWHPGMTLAEVVGDAAPFDFIVAAHVIEHIPNPIGWLQQLAHILRPGGVVSLVVPDKRFCFDARRQTTTTAQWVDAYLRGLDQPSFQQIFDHEANFAGDVDAAALWDGLDPAGLVRSDVPDPDVYAYARCLAQRDLGEFIDVHCSTFTPDSFGALLDATRRLDLLPFEVTATFETERPSFEFYVSLTRSAEWRSGHTRAEVGPSPKSVLLSPREIRLVLAKRRLAQALRSVTPRRRS